MRAPSNCWTAGVIGSAELQRREAELQQAGAGPVRRQASGCACSVCPKTRSQACRNSRGLSSVTNVVSSIDGIVLERKATIGQIVQAVEPVFVIADLSHVWLVADVPEQSAGQHQSRQSRGGRNSRAARSEDQGHALVCQRHRESARPARSQYE